MWEMWESIGTVVAAVLALVSAGVAILARRDSRSSAESSRDAADAAQHSLDLARQQDARTLERRDVRWERIKSGGVLEYRNVGTTTAHDVTAVLTINGERVPLNDLGDVQAGGSFSHDASDTYAAAVRADRARTQRMNAGGMIFASRGPEFVVTARITWESELGIPGVQEC